MVPQALFVPTLNGLRFWMLLLRQLLLRRQICLLKWMVVCSSQCASTKKIIVRHCQICSLFQHMRGFPQVKHTIKYKYYQLKMIPWCTNSKQTQNRPAPSALRSRPPPEYRMCLFGVISKDGAPPGSAPKLRQAIIHIYIYVYHTFI